MVQIPVLCPHPSVTFVTTMRQTSSFTVCTHQNIFQQTFFHFTPSIHQIMIQTPIHFHCQLVTFVATIFFLVHSTGLSFNRSSSNSHQNTHQTIIFTAIHNLDCNPFSPTNSYICCHKGPYSFFIVQSRVFTRSSNIYWTKINIFLSPIGYTCDHHVANLVFLMCALNPLVFNGSFSNSHQIFIGPWRRAQCIVSIHY